VGRKHICCLDKALEEQVCEDGALKKGTTEASGGGPLKVAGSFEEGSLGTGEGTLG